MRTRSRGRRIKTGIQVALSGLLLIAVCAVAWVSLNRESLGATPVAMPERMCVLSGTPVSGVAVDPAFLDCEPASPGTPVAAGGLTVTLSLSSDRAAPQEIVVTIIDAAGKPVDDAMVTLVNRHLEMDHGDFVRQLVHDRDGRYLGKQVGMGMGGRWQTEIQVARPGQEVVTFVFEERLKGIGE